MKPNSLAIITGASRGIGLATAARFLREGWDVGSLSRTAPPLAGVAHYACDLGDSAQIPAALHRMDLTRYDTISLIHNAALARKDDASTLTETAFGEVLKINVLAPQIINRHVIPFLRAGSSILYVGSTLSTIAAPNMLSYVVSKHALAGMMKSTALDLAEKSIHTCLICPGFTETQMLAELTGRDEGALERIRQMVLLQRLIDPAEIAECIYFCSQNPVINGSVLGANLGQK